MRYIGRDKEHVFLKCRHCKKIGTYDREAFEQQKNKKCINCDAGYRIAWGYPVKIPSFLRWSPFLIMTGLSILVIFIICFPPFQRHYYFNKSITALNPLVASILVPALCSVMSIIAEVRFSDTAENGKSGWKDRIKLLSVIAVESIALIFIINAVIEVKYHCLEIENAETGEIQQYFGGAIGEFASGKGRLFDSHGNLIYIGEFKDNLYDGVGQKWELIKAIGKTEATQSYQCVYAGAFKKGLPHGQGREFRYDAEYTFQKDEKKSPYLYYEGEFVEGEYCGYGTLYDVDSKYEGMFFNGEANGYVKKWFIDSGDNKLRKMEAIYVNGKVNGDGKKYFSDGKICFDGVYKDGKAVSGLWYFMNGNLRYEGELNGSEYNGKGTLYWQDGGIRYEGEWVDNKFSGEGTLYWENGQIRYEGEWVDDKRQGYGTGFWENGKIRYSGYWENDQYSGNGTVYYENGTDIHYEGDFVNNYLQGRGTEYYRNGNPTYEGGWSAGNWNGKGIWYWDNKNKYCDGTFIMGQITGEGILYKKEGPKIYEGYLVNGLRNGWGTSYWEDGTIQYEGNWSDNMYSGEGTEYDSEGNIINKGIFNAGVLVSEEVEEVDEVEEIEW